MTGNGSSTYPPPGPVTVAVVGAGVMGRGIAQVAVTAGCDVWLIDIADAVLADAVAFIDRMLDRAVAKGRLSRAAAHEARERLHPVPAQGMRYAAVDVVIEAVTEELTLKQQLLRDIEEQVRPEAILATNTSALSISAIGSALKRPERLCGMHFFNPVPLMRLVEVVPGERTSEAVVQAVVALARRFGHTPVRVVDTPGFLVNHTGRAYSTESLRVVDEAVASPYDVDRLCREAAGFRMGPFELFDLTGLDVSVPVMESVYRGFYDDPRLRPSPTARRRLAAGLLGRKTAKGFYTYVDGVRVDPPDSPVREAYRGEPVWVSPADPGAAGLRELLAGAGVTVERGEEPSDEAVVLVTPWGSDVTSAVVARRLPRERTLGVDPLGDYRGRLTLATTPATGEKALLTARSALAATGRPVTQIADSPGFVVQRIVMMIVNTAAEIAQCRIAGPSDIDRAVTLGLGYPMGPLAWGDAIGPATVLHALQGLYEVTGDPRYRPSLWLARRARLGMSLLTTEPGLPSQTTGDGERP